MDLLKKSLLKRGTMIPLSDKVEGLPLYILQRLQDQAKPFDSKAEFRFVGGCVRDIFLERKPKDIDIVTNTTARTLEQMGLTNVGKAFPVYLYQDPEFGQMEVAVARSEEKTGMGHKGFETVPTGNFQDDQVRRDLTINAMMVDAEGNLYGPDGAIEHIKSKTLENTSDKFSEDPLRVFRAARFLAQFGQGWRISLPLIEQMSKVQPELQTLPMDRVREEFRKAMNGKEPMNFFHALQAADCLEPWFGEVSENWDAVEQMCVKPGWDAEQRMVGIGSVLQVPGSLFNRLGLSEGLKRAAEWVKTNRQRVERGSTLSPDETVKLVQSGNQGVIEFKKLLECTLAAPKDQEYFIAAASKIKSADMTGVRGRDDAHMRMVEVLTKTSSISDLKEIIKIQTSNGNWNYDPYMHGLANGLILAETTVTDSEQDPVFLEAPEQWLGDKTSSQKLAMSVTEAVEEAAEQVHEELQRKPKPWQTPAFKQWFGNSKVVNPDGTPKRVMHGTTHDFDQFAPVNQSQEGHYGAGYYFTDCPKDVSENYGAIDGPDLTSRIKNLAEQIIQDWEDNNGEGHNFNPEEEVEGFDPDDDQSYGTPMYKALREAAERKAKEMLAGRSTGHVIPVFLKIENPVIVASKGGSYLPGGDSGFDPENEDDWIDGPEDTKLYEAWEETCSTFDAYKPESIWDQVMDYGGSLTALQFEEIVRESDTFIEADGAGTALSYFYDLMGYDGIIMDVADASWGKQMKVGPGTRHYIVWDPKQIKSAIGNRGTWDPTSPLLTASPHMRMAEALTKTAAKLNGKSFWCGSVDVRDGHINETHTYEEAESHDFHHSFYFSNGECEKMDDGDAAFFWVVNHEVVLNWTPLRRDMNAKFDEDALRQAILQQITFDTPKTATVAEEADEIIDQIEEEETEELSSIPDPAKRDYSLSLISPRLPKTEYEKDHEHYPYNPQKRLQPDLATMLQHSGIRRNLNLMTKYYPGMSHIKGPTKKKADQIIQQIVDNLVWLFEEWKEHRDVSREWYVGGHSLIERWSKRFKLGEDQLAGVIAALSPQKDWFSNVSLAERILIALRELPKADQKWTPRMGRVLDRLESSIKEAKPFAKEIRGKTLAQLTGKSVEDLYQMALWIRTWDEATNDPRCLVLTPHGQFGGIYMQDSGLPYKANKWCGINTIIKCIRCCEATTAKEFSALVSQMPKVRSFYNNLLSPHSADDVTIDTHAIAAALLRPLGAASVEVRHGLSLSMDPKHKVPAQSDSGVLGLYGLYSIYAEAYRLAAKQVGVLPRELQSITWEAARNLFKSTSKKGLTDAANQIWESYSGEEIDGQTARQKIKELAGGFDQPSWIGSNSEDHEKSGDSSFKSIISSSSISRKRLGTESSWARGGGRVTSRFIPMTLQEEEEWDEREELNQQKREIEKHDEPKTSELNLKKKEEDLWELGLPLLKRSLLKHTI